MRSIDEEEVISILSSDESSLLSREEQKNALYVKNDIKHLEDAVLKDLGAGEVQSLDVLNELIAAKSSEKSFLMKIFHYVEGMQQIIEYFKKHKVQMEQIMPSFPKRSILSSFLYEFAAFRQMPKKCKKKILAICKPLSFDIRDRVKVTYPNGVEHGVLRPLEEGMFLICKGEVILFKSYEEYSEFLQNEEHHINEQITKQGMKENVNYSGLAQVGWVITQFLLRDPKLSKLIEDKVTEAKRGNLMQKFSSFYTILQQGEVFGDFTMLQKELFKPFYAIALQPETKIIYISNEQLKKILQEDPMIYSMMKKKFPHMAGSSQMLKQMCNSMEEVEFYPGSVITYPRKPAMFIYLIKQGTCAVKATQDSKIKDDAKKRSVSQNDRADCCSESIIAEIVHNEFVGDDFLLTIQPKQFFSFYETTQ